jgi:hypothetical protein
MDPTTTKLFLSATSIDQLVVTRENGHVVQWQRLQVWALPARFDPRCLTGDLFPKNNVAGLGCTHEACEALLDFVDPPEGRVVCIVARASMRIGCTLCACGGVSECVYAYVQIQLYLVRPGSKKKKTSNNPLCEFLIVLYVSSVIISIFLLVIFIINSSDEIISHLHNKFTQPRAGNLPSTLELFWLHFCGP